MISTKAVYDSNKEFHDYVDRYARERRILVLEALTHKMVEEVADYYLKKDIGKENERGI